VAIDPRTRPRLAKIWGIIGAAAGAAIGGWRGLVVGAVLGYFGYLFLSWITTPRWRGRGPVPPGEWR
jgi:hypothetical protein